MKVKPEHYAELRELMREGITKVPPLSAYMTRDPVVPRIDLTKDPARRRRWDALYAADSVNRSLLMWEIYDYANDTHLDTAMRNIVEEFRS